MLLVIKFQLSHISSLWERVVNPVILIIDVVDSGVDRPLLGYCVIDFGINHKIRANAGIRVGGVVAVIKLAIHCAAVTAAHRCC